MVFLHILYSKSFKINSHENPKVKQEPQHKKKTNEKSIKLLRENEKHNKKEVDMHLILWTFTQKCIAFDILSLQTFVFVFVFVFHSFFGASVYTLYFH